MTKGNGNERRELEVVAKINAQSSTKLHLWKKVLKFQTLSNLCGHKQNKIMTNMLNEWKTKRILLKKKIGLLKQG
jgi:hypothetical protein